MTINFITSLKIHVFIKLKNLFLQYIVPFIQLLYFLLLKNITYLLYDSVWCQCISHKWATRDNQNLSFPVDIKLNLFNCWFLSALL
jgi:hypothetical protein